jgi:hypothetical protein
VPSGASGDIPLRDRKQVRLFCAGKRDLGMALRFHEPRQLHLHPTCGAEGGEATITEESMKKSAAVLMWACAVHVRDCDYQVLHPVQMCAHSDGCGACTLRKAQRMALNRRSKG